MKMIIKPKKTKMSEKDLNILYEIKKVNSELNKAYSDFEYQTDSDLLDASIYYLNCLKSKNSYLIKKAKENNIKSPAFAKEKNKC